MRDPSDGLSAAQLAALARQLHAARRAALRQLNVTDETLSDVQAQRADGVADDEHDPEGPTMSFEWSLLSGTREDTETELAMIDAALARIASGAYGTCQRCGRQIGLERLKARPSTGLCIECARASERRA